MYTTKVEKNDFEIALRLKRVREFLGLSQREFAKQLGVTNGAIGLWEAEKRVVPGPVIRLIEIYEAEMGIVNELIEDKNSELEQILITRISRNLQYLKISSVALQQWFWSAIKSYLRLQKSPAKKTALLALANQITGELGNMKGLPMKIGQMIGVLDLGLPTEVNAAFAQLYNSSTPMSSKLVNAVFKEETGKLPKDYFACWSVEPFSAASIGQVHLARLKTGETVAVKVQYPDIKETFRNDLKNLSNLSKFNRYLFLEENEGDLIQELHDRLLEECDYKIEAQNQLQFHNYFSSNENVKVPLVYPEHSTSRVLVAEYSTGLSFSDFIREASTEERLHAAEVIWQATFESWVYYSKVHADPHPGNFLFEDEKVVFLDFGCIKAIPPATYEAWKQFFKAMIDHRFDQAIDLLGDMGMFPKEGVFDRGQFLHVMKLIYDPYLTNRVYTFSKEQVESSIKEWFVNGPKGHFSVSKNWIFLMRSVWGLSTLMAKMGATANWQEKMLALLYSESKTSNAKDPLVLPRASQILSQKR